jgi:hypothetical protein
MTKRKKKRSQPNLPEETLARARREAGIEEEEESEAAPAAEILRPVESSAPAPRPRPDALPTAQRRKRRREIVAEDMTHAEIADLLTHPTKTVTVEELKAQYTYVVTDLRSMGALAAFLFIAMIVVARFL